MEWIKMICPFYIERVQCYLTFKNAVICDSMNELIKQFTKQNKEQIEVQKLYALINMANLKT